MDQCSLPLLQIDENLLPFSSDPCPWNTNVNQNRKEISARQCHRLTQYNSETVTLSNQCSLLLLQIDESLPPSSSNPCPWNTNINQNREWISAASSSSKLPRFSSDPCPWIQKWTNTEKVSFLSSSRELFLFVKDLGHIWRTPFFRRTFNSPLKDSNMKAFLFLFTFGSRCHPCNSLTRLEARVGGKLDRCGSFATRSSHWVAIF